MANDDVLILCNRTTRRDTLIVDGASKTKCEICGHEVWIAPSSRRAKEQMKAKVVCDVCGPNALKPEPGGVTEILPMSKEQAGEIQDTLDNRKRQN